MPDVNIQVQHIAHNSQQNKLTYAYVTAGTINTYTNNNNYYDDLQNKLTQLHDELKDIFTLLINKNSMILTMLITVINKLAQ